MAVDNINLFLEKNVPGLGKVKQKSWIAIHKSFVVVNVEIIDIESMIIPQPLITISFMGDDNDFSNLMREQAGKFLDMYFNSSNKGEIKVRDECDVEGHSQRLRFIIQKLQKMANQWDVNCLKVKFKHFHTFIYVSLLIREILSFSPS